MELSDIADNNRYWIYIVATFINHKTSFRVNEKTHNQTKHDSSYYYSLLSKKNIHMQYTMVIKEKMI